MAKFKGKDPNENDDRTVQHGTSVDSDILLGRMSRALGKHIMIRFDPLRVGDTVYTKDNGGESENESKDAKGAWTVVIDGIRLCDTDQPVTKLVEYVQSQQQAK